VDSGPGGTALAEQRAPEETLPGAPPSEASGEPVSSLKDIVALAERHREMDLRHWLVADIHLVRFSPGRIELRQNENSRGNMVGALGEILQSWTGRRWIIVLSEEPGEPTLEAQAEAKVRAKLRAAEDDPLVRQVLKNFPDAEISGLRESDESGDKEGSQHGDTGYEESGPDDETGAGDAGQDGGDAGRPGGA
jgi:DNA polymerase-3 subunit gamma/tau